MSAPTRIVILGGGFGGVYAALELEKRLARRSDVRVTLVSRDNFILFTPMLHEVAASDLDVTHIVNPLRKMLRHVDFFHGEACGVDAAKRVVRVRHGADGHPHELEYDHLLLALGSVTSTYGLPGLRECALTMKTLGDAIHLRNQAVDCLDAADFECLTRHRPSLLTFVVAGGGFAGVETVAALNDFLRESLRFYPHLTEDMLRVVLIHAGDHLLPEIGPELGDYACGKLRERGVEVRLGARVAGFEDGHVRLAGGEAVPTATFVWTAGTEPAPLLAALPFPRERGRVKVDPCLRVEGFPGVWAVGDCASVPDVRTGGTHPPTAQHAIREGRIAARNIEAAVLGRPAAPFRFRTLGQLAAIGRRSGVARILGFRFSGFLAWWLWRTIYLAKLPGFERKVRVMIDWTLDVLFSKDLVQIPTQRTPAPLPEPTPPPARAREPETAVAGA